MWIRVERATMYTSRPVGSRRTQREVERRRRDVQRRGGVDDLEVQRGRRQDARLLELLGHAALSRSSAKKPATAVSICRPARDPLPAHAHEADEPVALVDRDDRMLPRAAEPVDDHGLDVGLEPLEHGIRGDELLPGAEVELALGGPGRARVHGDDTADGAAAEEEHEPDRDPERRPQLVRELEPLQPGRPRAGRPVRPVAGEERAAGLARADDPPLLDVEHVAVVGRDRHRAQVAALLGRSRGLVGCRPVHHVPIGQAAQLTDRAALDHETATLTLPAILEQRHRRELEVLPDRAAGERQLEAAPAAGAGEQTAVQLGAVERRPAAGAGVPVGEQRSADVRDQERHDADLGLRHLPDPEPRDAGQLHPSRLDARLRGGGGRAGERDRLRPLRLHDALRPRSRRGPARPRRGPP